MIDFLIDFFFQGLFKKGLYHFSSSMFESTSPRSKAFVSIKVSSSLWHARLGHPTDSILRTLLNLAELSFNSNKSTCNACLQGKMHKFPFPVSSFLFLSSIYLIHSDDVWGSSL